MNIEANAGAKAFARTEIYIDAPPENVYRILSDINRWPEWQKSVSSAKVSAKPEEGTEFRWKANGMTVKSRLHTTVPARAFGWTGKVWWYRAVRNWFITPEGKGTRLIVAESMSGMGAGLMQNMLRNSVRQNANDLKLAAEKHI
ncbi:MAG: SRPBCC family protein [Cyclobacteriaceae bacterium]